MKVVLAVGVYIAVVAAYSVDERAGRLGSTTGAIASDLRRVLMYEERATKAEQRGTHVARRVAGEIRGHPTSPSQEAVIEELASGVKPLEEFSETVFSLQGPGKRMEMGIKRMLAPQGPNGHADATTAEEEPQLGEAVGKGGEETAKEASEDADKAEADAKKQVEQATKEKLALDDAAEKNEAAVRAGQAAEQTVKMEADRMANDEKAAAEKAKEAEKNKQEAEDKKTSAEEALEKAKKAAKDAGVVGDRRQNAFDKADAVERMDMEKVHKTKADRDEKHKTLLAAKEKLGYATAEFDKARHEFALASGDLQEGESVEDYKKRKEKEDVQKAMKLLSTLDDALAAEDAANAKAEASKAANEQAIKERDGLDKAAKEAAAQSAKLQAELEKARENGTVTAEMEAAAAAALKAAASAKSALEDKDKEVDKLKKDAANEAAKVLEAGKKSGAMKKLVASEKTLIEAAKKKLGDAMDNEKKTEKELEGQQKKVADAKEVAKTAEEGVAKATDALVGKKKELAAVQSEQEKVKSEIEIDTATRLKLSDKQKRAANIEIPNGTSVKAANEILDSKHADLSKATGPLLQAIEKQKAAVAHQQELEGKVTEMSSVIKIEADEVQKDQQKADEAVKEVQKEQGKRDNAQLQVDQAKELVTTEEASEQKAVQDETKLKADEDAAEENQKAAEDASEKVKEMVVEEGNEIKKDAKDAEAAVAKTKMASDDMVQDTNKIQMVTVPPTPPPTVFATPAPTVTPTAAPTISTFDKMVQSTPCADKWKEECELLTEHCSAFKSMKLYCKKKCGFCASVRL